jgi:hypothetical protein
VSAYYPITDKSIAKAQRKKITHAKVGKRRGNTIFGSGDCPLRSLGVSDQKPVYGRSPGLHHNAVRPTQAGLTSGYHNALRPFCRPTRSAGRLKQKCDSVVVGLPRKHDSDGDRCNLCSVLGCQLTGGSAVTTTNIDYFIARFYFCFLHNDVHQASHRDFGALSAFNPKTMMHMLTPKLSVKGIQFIVVVSYCRLVKRCVLRSLCLTLSSIFTRSRIHVLHRGTTYRFNCDR